jgi:hypothetical protein
VGPLGVALWVTGLAYCNRNLTDGFIPWSVARQLVNWEYLEKEADAEGRRKQFTVAVTCGMSGDDVRSDRVIGLLCGAGLWEQAENDVRGPGYLVHDYGDYQPLKADIEEENASRSAAGKLGAAKRWHGKSDSKAIAPAIAPAMAPTKGKPWQNDASDPVPDPVPDPDPDPDPERSTFTANAVNAARDGGDGELVKTLRSRHVNGAARLVKEHGAERCLQAVAYVDSLEGVESWTGMLVTVVKSGEPIPSPLENNFARGGDAYEQPLYRAEIGGLTKRGEMLYKMGMCDELGQPIKGAE